MVEEYTAALELLDSYDHQSLKKPDGTKCVYQLTYEESREFIDKMSFDSDVFGVEKEPGKVAGILAAVYQDVFMRFIQHWKKRRQTFYTFLLRTIRSLMDANE